MNHTFALLLVLAISASLVSAQTLFDQLSQPGFSFFLASASRYPNIVSILQGTTNYSVFAPTNGAFPNGTFILDLNTINYHIIPGSPNTTVLTQIRIYPTLLNLDNYGTQYMKLYNSRLGQLLANGIVTVATPASNGVLYTIDSFLPLPSDAMTVLSRYPVFSKLVTVLNKLNLTIPEGSTLFAPTNAALDEIPSIEANPTSYGTLLSWHVSPNTVIYSTNVTDGSTIDLSTLTSLQLQIKSTGGTIYLNNTIVIDEDDDLLTYQGVIHGILHVVTPPPESLLSVLNLTSLLSALERTGLLPTVAAGDLTIFAPTNQAFDDLKQNGTVDRSVLLYHVVPGKRFINNNYNATPEILTTALTLQSGTPQVLVAAEGEVNDALVFLSNQVGLNIVVNIIDDVLPTPVPASATLVARPDFTYLIKAATAYGLDSALDQPNITIFAPSDPTWLSNLPYGYTDFLFATANTDSRTKAIQLIKNHVVPALLYSPEIAVGNTTLNTLEGDTIVVTKNNNGVFVNNVPIYDPNIVASNAVIHAINGFVFPKNFNISTLQLLPFINCTVFADYIQKNGLTKEVSGNVTIFVVQDANIKKDVGEQLNQVSALKSIIIPEYLSELENNKRYQTLQDKITIRRDGTRYYLEYETKARTNAKFLKHTFAYPTQQGSIIVLDQPLLDVEEDKSISPGIIALIVIIIIVIVVAAIGVIIWKRKKVPYESVK